MGGFDRTRTSGLSLEELWSRLMETAKEEEEYNIKAAQAIQKTTTPQDPGTQPSTSSLSHVSDCIYTKISIIMVYICPGCYRR